MIPGTTVNVLVIDDDEDDLYLVKDALSNVKATRYVVTTASSPLMAMSQLAQTKFDIIFSDYRLGAVTGIDVINNVRGAGIDTPIILLTGIADQVVDDAALAAGSSDFIPKTNLTPDVLDRSVRYSLAHANRQRLLQSILKNTKSGISVVTAEGAETLSNEQMSYFANLAFAGDKDAKQKLIDLVLNSDEQDIVIGSTVLEHHVTPLADGSRMLTLHDVTDRVNALREREQAEEKIRAIALQDTLTSLPNRMAFNNYLDACLPKAKGAGSKVAVLLFDFNRFKEANDLFGHAAGDHILRQAAFLLRSTLTEDEFCARLGGDEFVMVQSNSDEEKALGLAKRIADKLNLSLKWQDKVIEASVTVGVALYPQHGQHRQELLANADLAMYRGKSETENAICIFDSKMDQYVRERRALALDLRHAIQNDELCLNLQPQFATETGVLVGFEALLRWNCHVRGRVSPAEFIPVAEENGLIIEIDKWVLKRSCQLLVKHEWIPRLAVNISAKAICQSTIVADIRSTLLEFGISPKRLELEVTETALIYDLTRALHNLRQIKSLGIAVAMDDFGTGYSSMSMLSSFPFDRIKIDGSFIQHTSTNERAGAIFKAVVGLGKALNVPVLAEGVETARQLEFANAAGCEELQGFYFGRPISEPSVGQIYIDLGGNLELQAFKSWQNKLAPTPAKSPQLLKLRTAKSA